MTAFTAHVADARAALARADQRAALDAALAAWRLEPHGKLAEAIVWLGALVARTVPPLSGKSTRLRERVWAAMARKGDPAELDHLLATLAEVWTTAGRIARLDQLAALPADPRVGRHLVKLLADPQLEDPILRQHVAALLAERLGDPFLAPAPPDAEVDALHAALDTSAQDARDAARHAALLAAVYAAPADDAPRSIYADWLQARGDPRGELIALQLAPAPTDEMKRRASELVNTYKAQWLGALASHLQWPAFERGFLHRCDPKLRANGGRPPDDPAWATVEVCSNHLPPLASARALREVHQLELAELAYLATFADPPRIEILDLRDYNTDDRAGAVAAIARCRLPALRRLSVYTGFNIPGVVPATCAWPWRALGIAELSINASVSELAAWLPALDQTPKLQSLEMLGPQYDVRTSVTRSAPTARFDTLDLHATKVSTYAIADEMTRIAEGLTALPADAFAHITLALPSMHVILPIQLRAIHEAVDRQTRLVTRSITHRER